MCLKPLIQLSAKVKSCRPQSIRGTLRGNAKRQIDVVFLTQPSIKITSSVVMNAYLAVKNVDMSFKHNMRGFIVKPTHSPNINLTFYVTWVWTGPLSKTFIVYLNNFHIQTSFYICIVLPLANTPIPPTIVGHN